ncbi:ead/Ea22-like family protein [Enterobacter bugandensis]|uniref:ead/Ea22-like family protein n=1 Tax=Enterobacter bugandensis TaxID=881260 RepID=UPI001CC235C9|nr:ead/Ea22-like family protein [Enterobacter bugandensis]
MSNIDKQALRDIAAAAVSTPLWHAVGVFGEVVDPANPEWKPVHDFCKTFTAERVLALLDELEAKDSTIATQQQEIRTLLNALGQASEKRNAEQADIIAKQEKWIKDIEATMITATDRAEAAEKRIAELSGEFFALPPLNDELIAILGRPNFTCAHLAELLRKGGQDISRKSECEQAAVIYWFLDLYLKYGDKWESIAKDDIQSRVAMFTAGAAKGV